MKVILTIAFLLVGGTFSLLAAVGVVRMPDLFTRLQVVTKAATLGVSCLIIAVAIHFADFGVATRAGLVVVFFFLTAPVSAHIIGRVAYYGGVPLWKGTIIDELSERTVRDRHGRGAGETGGPEE
jgi:multicomponent Na+:H+ antiporter subunit G